MPMLDERVAIVTGAGRGLGREEARALAAAGAAVIVNDIGASLSGEGQDESPAAEVVRTITAAGGTAVVNGEDVGDWEGARRTIEQAYDTFGRLDVLVNNAGVLRDRMSFNMSEDEFDLVMKVHTKGHFAMSRHACERWRNAAKTSGTVFGRIINTSSEAGLFGNAGQANYAAAKAGIAALTWVEARELSRYGVTSNAIAPRARTRMTETLFGGDGMAAKEGVFDQWDPRNIANVVAFLAAPESADVNGQILVVFGADVYVMSAFQAIGQVTRDKAWTPSELVAAKGDMFKGISSGVPDFSFI